MITRLILILIAICVCPLFVGTLHACYWWSRRLLLSDLLAWLMCLALGFMLRYLIAFRLQGLNRLLVFLETLEHELIHALVSTLTLRPPRKLNIQDDGNGLIEVERASIIVLLAPYFLPLYTSLGCLVFVFLRQEIARGLFFFLAIGFGFYLHRLLRETRPIQSDFSQTGFWTTLPLVLMWQMMLFVLVALGVCNEMEVDSPSFTQIWELFVRSIEQVKGLLNSFILFFRQ